MTALNLVGLFMVAVMVPGALAQGGVASCCRKISDTQVHRDLLTKYYIQRPPSCALHAVKLQGKYFKQMCPNSRPGGICGLL
uniref:Chemokine interleukin-8-like domain-containing protein n=1 Tax=Hippocampus comes TaxID=109280 RepID=A0A3Q2XSY7_HIPCM